MARSMSAKGMTVQNPSCRPSSMLSSMRSPRSIVSCAQIAPSARLFTFSESGAVRYRPLAGRAAR